MLDIVIPVHDNLPWLKLCLGALHAFTRNPYRVIVVDNASVESETRAFLRGKIHDDVPPHGHVQVLHLGTNESFSHSVNAGIQAGSNKNVVILNSDVVVMPDWDTFMLADLVPADVGLVGARTNAAAGFQAMAKRPELVAQSNPDNAPLHAAGSLQPPDRAGMPTASAPYLIFMCVAMKRATYDKIGPLDGETCRGWGGGEDLDYSWRVQDAGLRCVISAAYVLHGCSQTYTTRKVTSEQKARLEAQNLARLVEKHGLKRVRVGTKTQPKVVVAIFSRTEQTWRLFAQNFMTAYNYACTRGWHVAQFWSTRTMIHLAREQVADYFMKVGEKSVTGGGVDYDYVVFLDDDHTFPADAIYRLVSSGKDVCGALAYRRQTDQRDPTRADHQSCAFKWGKPDQEGTVLAFPLEGVEHTGLQRVDAIGFGMTAVRMDVFRGLAEKRMRPFFEFTQKFGEDIGFCAKAGEAGYEIWCDTDLVLGHLGDPILVDEEYVAKWRRECAAAGGRRPGDG